MPSRASQTYSRKKELPNYVQKSRYVGYFFLLVAVMCDLEPMFQGFRELGSLVSQVERARSSCLRVEFGALANRAWHDLHNSRLLHVILEFLLALVSFEAASMPLRRPPNAVHTRFSRVCWCESRRNEDRLWKAGAG